MRVCLDYTTACNPPPLLLKNIRATLTPLEKSKVMDAHIFGIPTPSLSTA